MGRSTPVPPLLAGRRRSTFARLIGIGTLQATAMVGTTLLTATAFDRYVRAEADLADATLLFLALVALAIVSALLRWREQIDAEELGQTYVHDLRLVLFDHWHRLDARALRNRGAGAMTLRFVNDMTAIRQWVSLGIARLAVSSVLIVGGVGVLATMSPALAIAVACVCAAGAAASVVLGRPLEGAVRLARSRRTSLAGNIAEKIAAMQAVQAAGQQHREAARLARQSNALVEAMLRRAARIGALRATADATVRLTTIAVLLVGAWAVAHAQATPGSIVAAMSVIALLVPSMRDIGRSHEYWKSAKVSREKLDAFLSSGPTISDRRRPRPLPEGPGRLNFQNVRIAPITQRFSASIAAGSRVAITGAPGSGKSTLLALVARLLDPASGHIEIDGADLRRVRLAALRRAVGLARPDIPLLGGSIRRNVLYRHPRATDAEFEDAVRASGLDAIAAALPQGFDTRLARDGSNLSADARARIALARALVGRPRILLLDEADTDLDESGRSAFARVVTDYPGTVLMVTRNAELAASADEIWQIRDGAVAVVLPPGTRAKAQVVDLWNGTNT